MIGRTRERRPKAGALERAGVVLDQRLPLILRVAGGLGLAVAGTIEGNWWFGSWRVWTYLVAGAAFFAGEWRNESRERSNRSLQNELEVAGARLGEAQAAHKAAREKAAEDLNNVIMWQLRSIGQELGFTVADRITVFYYREGRLFFLARHSLNPDLERKGREEFSCDEGYLGSAWQGATVKRTGLPDPEGDPDGYRQAHLDAGLGEEAFESLTMRSRTYVGFTLRDPAGTGNVGVVMLESTEEDRLGDLDPTDLASDTASLSLGALTMIAAPPMDEGDELVRKGGF
jgi:hypothetical protein